MVTWTAITDASAQLNFTTKYLLRFELDGNPVYKLGFYESSDAAGDHYEYDLPTNVDPLLNATHFATLNEPV